MKAIVIISLIVVIGALSPAPKQMRHESKIQHREVGHLLDLCPVRFISGKEFSQNHDIARLYKRPNTRVRRALNFKTKYTRAKLA